MPFVATDNKPLYTRPIPHPSMVQLRSHMSDRMFFKGKSQTIEDWAKQYDINPITLTSRLLRGWPCDEACHRPVKQQYDD